MIKILGRVIGILEWVVLVLVCSSLVGVVGGIIIGSPWVVASSMTNLGVGAFMLMHSSAPLDKIRRKWFPRKLPVHPSTMNVVVIDEDNPELNEVFGVTKERGNEILEAMRTETGNDTSFVNALVSMSKNCKHPNELMYMSFMIGGHLEAQKNPLAQILGSVMRKGE